jgi:hypothetical protein|tara:strand:- start:403 stop:780 length:378 start_codon:yes stop_codon:yes gene_type:complete
MKKVYNPIYVKEYYEGYSMGINPFATYQCLQKKAAVYEGFQSGRSEYERMNGLISAGIPDRIVTDKVLEDFLLAGMLGMAIDTDNYTPFQIDVILVWYQSGIEKYDPSQFELLFEVLEEEGISFN